MTESLLGACVGILLVIVVVVIARAAGICGEGRDHIKYLRSLIVMEAAKAEKWRGLARYHRQRCRALRVDRRRRATAMRFCSGSCNNAFKAAGETDQ